MQRKRARNLDLLELNLLWKRNLWALSISPSIGSNYQSPFTKPMKLLGGEARRQRRWFAISAPVLFKRIKLKLRGREFETLEQHDAVSIHTIRCIAAGLKSLPISQYAQKMQKSIHSQ